MATLHATRPITLSAKLISAGLGIPTFTKHIYVDTRECVDRAGQPAFEHIYACAETGEERRWGLEVRKVAHDYSKEGN